MRNAIVMAAAIVFVFAATLVSPLAAQDDGWVRIFNGKDLEGWQANERPENWTVEDGMLVGRGSRSHLFYMKEELSDLHFKATIKLNHKGNSGMYIRAEFGPGWPKGYEAQVENSSSDPKKTGSLYNFANFYEQIIPDDTWWTQEVIARGNHIIIKVNDRVITDFIDEKNTFRRGYVALQQHDPGSVVMYKDIMIKRLD
jgi:hypothetical protein